MLPRELVGNAHNLHEVVLQVFNAPVNPWISLAPVAFPHPGMANLAGIGPSR
jgi:hypothetical protein